MSAPSITPAFDVGEVVLYEDNHARRHTGRILSIEAHWYDTYHLHTYSIEHPTYRNRRHYAGEENIIARVGSRRPHPEGSPDHA